MEFPEPVFQSQDWNHACFCTKSNLLIIMFYYPPGTNKSEKWSHSVMSDSLWPQWTIAHQASPSIGTDKLNTYLFLVCPEWTVALSGLNLHCFCLLLHNFKSVLPTVTFSTLSVPRDMVSNACSPSAILLGTQGSFVFSFLSSFGRSP